MKLIFREDTEEEEEVFGKGKKIDYVKDEEGEKKRRDQLIFHEGDDFRIEICNCDNILIVLLDFYSCSRVDLQMMQPQ